MLNINQTKWAILKELSENNKTPTDLTKKLKITLPSLHKQLKELEQDNLIKNIGKIKGRTRPYKEYSLGDGFIYFVKVMPGDIEKKELDIDENIKLHLKIWSIPQKEYYYYVEMFWYNLQEYIENIDAFVIYDSVAKGNAQENSSINALLLVKKDVKFYQKLFGVKKINYKDKNKVFMTKVFETDDFNNSLKKSSDFLYNVVKDNVIIYDPKEIFTKLKNEHK